MSFATGLDWVSQRMIMRFRAISLAMAILVLLLTTAVLVGWLFDIETLKSVAPAFPTMKFNTALALGLTAIAQESGPQDFGQGDKW